MFRGDRKPNWKILAKMANELSLEFKVETTTSLQKLIENELTDYHHKW